MIGFWKSKITEDFLSHGSGLTEDQIKILRELEPGDRLIIYQNDVKGTSRPPLMLKVYRNRKDN